MEQSLKSPIHHSAKRREVMLCVLKVLLCAKSVPCERTSAVRMSVHTDEGTQKFMKPGSGDQALILGYQANRS